MPGTQYGRVDFVIHISWSQREVRFGNGARRDLAFELDQLPSEFVRARVIVGGSSFSDAFYLWRQQAPPSPGRSVLPDGRGDVLERICLSVDDERVAVLPLEQVVAAELQRGGFRLPSIVRLESVPARVAQVPMTLPLRLLQLDPRGDFDLPSWLGQMFGLPTYAVQAEAGSSTLFARWSLPAGWKTADVLHLDRLPTLDERDRFRLSARDKPGSLGWLLRCTDLWNTRLVVMRPDVNEVTQARRLARQLSARGGPAVLVLDPAVAVPVLQNFFNKLIHDAPVDVALALAAPQGPPLGALFAGMGREELMRVSGPAERLLELVQTVRPYAATPAMSVSLDAMVANMPFWSFDLHETGGMVPLGQALDTLRTLRPVLPAAALPAEIRPLSLAPRFANLALWELDLVMGRQSPIPSPGALLPLGEPVVLGVQIGARDGFVPVLDAVALIEEPFKWEDGKEGVWLAVGVTGLDFMVSGAPLQEVWLPRSGASDVVEFVLAPMRAGVSQVRVCLYYGADLLQSHRLAARVVDFAAEDDLSTSLSIAEALGAEPERVGDAGWLARMEYAAAGDLGRPPGERDVALSIFANTYEGNRVFTVKAEEGYEVSLAGDTAGLADDIRSALDGVSRDVNGVYAFLARGGLKLHEASPQSRDAALHKLATVGWSLYSSIFSSDARDAMADDLGVAGRVIHIAHALLENVIPWAGLYDRPYDPVRDRDDAGRPVVPRVCPAGLPDAAGAFPAATCASHADCPLSPQGRAAALASGFGVTEDTLVCARHFWGFRNIIELPPYQEGGATGAGAGTTSAPPRRTKTEAKTPAAMLLGYNASLSLSAQHLAELAAVPAGRKLPAAWRAQESDRNLFLSKLKAGDADLVYLYCHARGGVADPATRPPALEFAAGPAGWIQPSVIASLAKLTHHPLVILNGCNTAKFSPDALSPFIRHLVRDCEAAGALGTEIPVFELLAGKVAVDFLGRFLNGEAAGAALLAVRRALMAGGNPLGLVYTLYAVSELTITQ
jgi:hypothetical protein